MSIRYRIDPKRRFVHVEPVGTLTQKDIFSFQKKVWSRQELAGFHELVDVTRVKRVEYESTESFKELANLSASMDPPTIPSKMAIVAATELHFGLGKMYQAFRAINSRSTREVRVFRELAPALKWLRLPKSALQGP